LWNIQRMICASQNYFPLPVLVLRIGAVDLHVKLELQP
jgi:hypothetical protein